MESTPNDSSAALALFQMTQYQQGQQVYQQGPLQGDDEGIDRPTQGKQEESSKKGKKPPRPYTEYNVFYHLEHKRILGELEEEQRQNQDTESGGDKNEESMVTYAEGKTTAKEGVILNHPSDPSDILPRPPRFAHLHLSPLWYDSTQKTKRKHRKSHGLIAFEDLTRRIAKAWSEVDADTKEYCKRVADRQLKIYKEESKLPELSIRVPNSGGEQKIPPEQQILLQGAPSASANPPSGSGMLLPGIPVLYSHHPRGPYPSPSHPMAPYTPLPSAVVREQQQVPQQMIIRNPDENTEYALTAIASPTCSPLQLMAKASAIDSAVSVLTSLSSSLPRRVRSRRVTLEERTSFT